jgi:hypothetical protein
MPWTSTANQSPLQLPRTPSHPPPVLKRVAFSLLSSSSPNLPSPTSPPSPAPLSSLPSATYHRFRSLNALLDPSPAVVFSTRPPLLDCTNARPPPLARLSNGSNKENIAVEGVKRDDSMKKRIPALSSIAVQTSPSVSTVQPRKEPPPALASTQASFVASLKSPESAVEQNEEEQRGKKENTAEEKVASPRRVLSKQPTPPQIASTQSSPPPAVPSPALATSPSPSVFPPSHNTAFLPQPRASPPCSTPPIHDDRLQSTQHQPTLKQSRPNPSSSLSTIGLSPFRYFLASRSTSPSKSPSNPSSDSKQRSSEATAGTGVWIELLSHGGDLLLDSRTKDGRVWVVSSNGTGSSVRYSPSLPLSDVELKFPPSRSLFFALFPHLPPTQTLQLLSSSFTPSLFSPPTNP